MSDIDLENLSEMDLIRFTRSSQFNASNYIFSKKTQQTKKQNKFPSVLIKNGVIANEDIMTNDIIEKCICIPLEFKSKYHHDKTILAYCVSFDKSTDDGTILYMLSGNGLLYKHNDNFNCVYSFNKENLLCNIIAKTPIKKGEEITINRYANS